MPHRIKKKKFKTPNFLSLVWEYLFDLESSCSLKCWCCLCSHASHSHYFTLFLFSFSVLFLVFEGAMFLGLWVVFLWSLLRISVVKFPGLVRFYRGIRLVFWGFFSGCFMWVLMVSFWSCFSVSKGIVRIFLGWFPMTFG